MAALVPPCTAGAAPADDPAAAAIDRAAAREAVARAQAAARAGDFETALAEYERALALHPSPKLYYNIGVCHQHLAAKATDEAKRRTHLKAAIAAYNRYLRARPDAPDAQAVARTIEALGGVPDRPGHWELGNLDLFDPDAPPPALEDNRRLWEEIEQAPAADETADEARDEAGGGEALPAEGPNSTRATPPAPPAGPKVAVGLWGQVGSLHPHDTRKAGLPLDRPVAMGAGVEVLGLLGSRRRAYVGGSFDFVWPLPVRGDATLRLGMLALTARGGYLFEPGRRGRIALGLGGGVGIVLESLRRTSDAPVPVTACGPDWGRTESHRFGLSLEARPALIVRLGPRRAHGIVIAARPTLLLVGEGWLAEACRDDGQGPFEEVGLPAGAAFAVSGSLGYRVRF